MKRTKTLNRHLGGAIVLFILFFLCQSCFREDLTGTYPVFAKELVGDYLTNHPELFSEFNEMLNKSGTMGLLKAYGTYTVFAPTNEAVKRYYQYMSYDRGETITSYEQLSLSDIREFCYNHIIKGDSLKLIHQHNGFLSQRTMSGRFYSISSSDSAIVINDYCPILARDISLHNGVIHILGEAFRPAAGVIAEVFEKDSMRFSIYVKALKTTGVYDKMNRSMIEDKIYDSSNSPIDENGNMLPYPSSRFFGFTILAVSDADLANYVDVAAGLPNGIHSLADLEKLARHHYGIAFNHDADAIIDKKDPKHYLNRFISYHCFNRTLYSSRFVKDYFTLNHYPEYPIPEYIETMMENTIVEVLLDKQGKTIGPALAANSSSAYGVFNFDDPAQRALLTQLKDLPAGGAENGYYHGITRPIMYTKPLSDALSSKRLRMDIASFFPELTTNNLRGNGSIHSNISVESKLGWYIHPDYLDNFKNDADNNMIYASLGYEYFNNSTYLNDYIQVSGLSRFTIITCPIPAGTYEVRITWQTDDYAELFFDNIPCGPEVSYSHRRNCGFVKPGNDINDPEGYENDKVMRNHGYMKGPVCFEYVYNDVGDWSDYTIATAREDLGSCRKILGTYTFDKTENHFFTAIPLPITHEKPESIRFNIDYMEFCPVSYLDKEGID